MRGVHPWIIVITLTISCCATRAQEIDSLVLGDVGDVLSFEDSLSIFYLIDSVMQYADLGGSQLALRLGYNSNVMSAGRTLGIENFGLAPGISYYHKSGLYADLTGYWSKDFDPQYYLTVASLGYMHSFSKVFSFMAGYDRYLYNVGKDAYVPYKNTLSVTPVIDLKPLMFAVNYSFYFGDSHVHRIMPSLSLILEKKKMFNLIDRVTLSPAAYVLYGNEILTDVEIIYPQNLRELIQFFNLYRVPYKIVMTDRTVWGIMNYTFSLPLTISYKNWTLNFTYSYNIPKALPDEPLTISESSYLSGGLMYFFSFKRHKFTL